VGGGGVVLVKGKGFRMARTDINHKEEGSMKETGRGEKGFKTMGRE